DGGHEAAHLGLAPGGGDAGPGLVELPPQLEKRRLDRELLVPQLLAQPPQLVVGPVEVGDGLPGAGQVVELAPLHALPDLALDPRLPPHLRRLAVGRRRRLVGHRSKATRRRYAARPWLLRRSCCWRQGWDPASA